MHIHYLEIVTKDVDGVCTTYEKLHGVTFGAAGAAVESGAEIAHRPMELPGHGRFAIYIQGGSHHGLWQV